MSGDWLPVDGTQLAGVAVLVAMAAIAIVLAIAVLRLLRAVWRWAARGGSGRTKDDAPQSATAVQREPVAGGFVVTPADLLAIKSNLDAVSRQLGDLELKLRSNPPSRRSGPGRPSGAGPESL